MNKQVLVVGCGSIGERHVRCLQRTGRADVFACDNHAALLERIRKDYQITVFASLDEALGSRKFDGIVICTPAHTHIGMALTALRSGAGILIEKPLSVGIEQIPELREEIAKTKLFVGVAYIYHFFPVVSAVRDYLLKGLLGKPLHVNVVSGQHFPTFRPAYREIYFTRHETGGGAIQDALTHFFNAIEWMFGPTSKIMCDAKHQALDGVTVEDTVNAVARNGDVMVSYSMNQFQAPNETTFQIHCERGSLKIELNKQQWGVFSFGAANWEIHSAPFNHRDDLFVAQSNAFLDGLEGQPTALCTFEEAVTTLKLNIAALESARTGLPVNLK